LEGDVKYRLVMLGKKVGNLKMVVVKMSQLWQSKKRWAC
jgi:hypothetical protein